MSSIAISPIAVSRPAINHWIVACVVVVPTFMEILDTTITNVALRYIAGGLSAAQTDADWVITSYQPVADDPVPRHSRPGWRRVAAVQPGGAARFVPA